MAGTLWHEIDEKADRTSLPRKNGALALEPKDVIKTLNPEPRRSLGPLICCVKLRLHRSLLASSKKIEGRNSAFTESSKCGTTFAPTSPPEHR
jgi:hypothetical protein